MVFQKDEISQTLQAQQSLQVLELLLHVWLRKKQSRKDLPVQIQTSALELVISVSSVASGKKQVLLGCDSSHPRQCPNNHLATQTITSNVVQVSSKHVLFMPGVNNPHFLYKLRASLPLVENHIMLI